MRHFTKPAWTLSVFAALGLSCCEPPAPAADALWPGVEGLPRAPGNTDLDPRAPTVWIDATSIQVADGPRWQRREVAWFEGAGAVERHAESIPELRDALPAQSESRGVNMLAAGGTRFGVILAVMGSTSEHPVRWAVRDPARSAQVFETAYLCGWTAAGADGEPSVGLQVHLGREGYRVSMYGSDLVHRVLSCPEPDPTDPDQKCTPKGDLATSATILARAFPYETSITLSATVDVEWARVLGAAATLRVGRDGRPRFPHIYLSVGIE